MDQSKSLTRMLRFLRDQDEAPGEMFYTIYWFCIQGLCDQSYTSVFKYYFSNT